MTKYQELLEKSCIIIKDLKDKQDETPSKNIVEEATDEIWKFGRTVTACEQARFITFTESKMLKQQYQIMYQFLLVLEKMLEVRKEQESDIQRQ